MGLFDSIFEPPFKRRRDGTFSVNLPEDEREFIQGLVRQLQEMITTDNPALARLFPPPYGDDEERNQGYAVLAGSELLEGKLEAMDQMVATMQSAQLTEDELHVWMKTINDLRLVLGTILDVSDDDYEDEIPEDEHAQAIYGAYQFLGLTLERIVQALSS
ncbi:MAG TPA: DUF2017 family protein [Microthrixaceae bacterium]|nr:DUF2017 family protein [Microthrixaceae bacterium]